MVSLKFIFGGPEVLVLGLWSWAFGLGPLVLGLWSWAFGLGPLVLGLWSWAFGLGPLVLGLWSSDPGSAVCPLLTAYCLLLTAHCLPSFLLPGLMAGSPRLQASQTAGSIDRTLSVASEIRGTPTSASPAERSMIDAAPTTFAPLAAKAATVSRVEPPVVTTSSTTSTLSPGETEKPRRNTIVPFSRSVQMKRAPRARATSWPIMRPP